MKVDTYKSKDMVSQIGGISSKLTHYPNNLQFNIISIKNPKDIIYSSRN